MFSEHWFLHVLGKGSCHGDLAVFGANAIMALNNPQPTEFGASLCKGKYLLYSNTEEFSFCSVSLSCLCFVLLRTGVKNNLC